MPDYKLPPVCCCVRYRVFRYGITGILGRWRHFAPLFTSTPSFTSSRIRLARRRSAADMRLVNSADHWSRGHIKMRRTGQSPTLTCRRIYRFKWLPVRAYLSVSTSSFIFVSEGRRSRMDTWLSRAVPVPCRCHTVWQRANVIPVRSTRSSSQRLLRQPIGVAMGCSGCTPRKEEKNFRRNLQGKCVSVPQHTKCTTPSGRAIVNF